MQTMQLLSPNAKPLTEKAVIAHFEYIKRTAFKGRYYTVDTLCHYVRAKVLGIDLKVLGLYPEGFNESDITVIGRDIELVALQRQAPKIK